MSITNQCVKHFVESGGRVTACGKFVFGITGREIKQQLGGNPSRKYYAIRVHRSRTGSAKAVSHPVPVHKIVAYLKYGAAAFLSNTTRHLNDDPLDNSWGNIALGTVRENIMDRTPESRRLHAQKAGKASSKYSDELWDTVRQDHKDGLGYKKLRAKYGIPLGTLSYQLSDKAKRKAMC